jgi:guanylate kinase
LTRSPKKPRKFSANAPARYTFKNRLRLQCTENKTQASAQVARRLKRENYTKPPRRDQLGPAHHDAPAHQQSGKPQQPAAKIAQGAQKSQAEITGRKYTEAELDLVKGQGMTQITEMDDEIVELYERLNKPRPVLVIISGPSGVGKDATLQLMKENNASFHFVVTATTRPMRPGEVNGVDYHFISMGEFAEMIDQGELLEYAIVYGDYKGIPKKHVREALASGQDVIMRIDVQGAATMRKLIPNAVTIFLIAESEDELVRRLLQRKTEDADKLKMRIATARQELKRIVEFDYVVVNREDRLQETVDQVMSIIQAEKARVDWTPVVL